jgi:hypothetical protein
LSTRAAQEAQLIPKMGNISFCIILYSSIGVTSSITTSVFGFFLRNR